MGDLSSGRRTKNSVKLMASDAGYTVADAVEGVCRCPRGQAEPESEVPGGFQ